MAQNKILIYLMPIIMALFAWFYNAMFAIYMVTGALFGLATNPIITLIVDKLYAKNEQKQNDKTLATVSYSRKNIEKNKNLNNNSDVKVKNAKIAKNKDTKNKPLNNEILFKKSQKDTSKKDKK